MKKADDVLTNIEAPKEEEEPIVTTMTVETEVEMTSQTAYGPPPAWHSI